MMRLAPGLCAALLLSAAPAAAQDPLYVVGWWDGAGGRPGVWFRAEGPAVPEGVALEPVLRLEPGREVRPAPGRIVLSAELAVLLGVPPRTPTLLRLAPPEEPADPPDGATAARPAANAAAPAAPAGTPQERIAGLLAELQRVTAEATEADAAMLAASIEPPSPDPAPAAVPAAATGAPAARRGGLVPFAPGGELP